MLGKYIAELCNKGFSVTFSTDHSDCNRHLLITLCKDGRCSRYIMDSVILLDKVKDPDQFITVAIQRMTEDAWIKLEGER